MRRRALGSNSGQFWRCVGGAPAKGTSLAMSAHWSPIRSTQRMMCNSAAMSRRSPRDRRLKGEQREQALVDLDVATVDPGVFGDDDRGVVDVLVAERRKRSVELSGDQIEPSSVGRSSSCRSSRN